MNPGDHILIEVPEGPHRERWHKPAWLGGPAFGPWHGVFIRLDAWAGMMMAVVSIDGAPVHKVFVEMSWCRLAEPVTVCPDCHGSGRIVLFTSVGPCRCVP